MKTFETYLIIAGFLHFGLMLAGISMPRAVGLKGHLGALPPFVRRLFWVYYVFIGFVLASFGVLTLLHAQTLALGEPFARAFCGFVCLFWLMRLAAAALVLDVSPYLTTTLRRLGYQAMNLVFLYLPLVYGWAAIRPQIKGAE